MIPTDVLGAALAYAKDGWYVGPLRWDAVPEERKSPGSRLRKGWQDKTSRDPKVITSWFAGSRDGLFLHVGRSGAVVLDVDRPEMLTPELVALVDGQTAPFQSSRPDDPRRGHLVFQMPPGRTIGNGTGSLPAGFGDVRGNNGVIVVEPTQHSAGGRYRWERRGPVPPMPEFLADMLPDGGPAVPVHGGEGSALLDPLDPTDAMCGNMRTVAERRAEAMRAAVVQTRHNTMRDGIRALVGLHVEGHPGLRAGLDLVKIRFLEVMNQPGDDPRKEWHDALDGAAAKYAAGSHARRDPCIPPVAGAGVGRLAGAPVEPPAPDAPVRSDPSGVTGADRLGGDQVLESVAEWFRRFVCAMDDSDLDLLALWAAHTYLVEETYTTPRLVLDSPVPESGKTTVLEHLQRLCRDAVQVAALSSSALLVRMLDVSLRTILIDEADRALDPDKDGVGEYLAVINSGYKRGATRPVLVPAKGGSWTVSEMPTFSPVAMAGNNPRLPDDTRSRCIRVLLMPDVDGVAEESDWELIEDDAKKLGALLASWADQVRDQIKVYRPPLPNGVIGRARERWLPLKRIAVAAGGRWPDLVDVLAVRDVERVALEREEGITVQKPPVALLNHIADVWPDGQTYCASEELIRLLVAKHPMSWGALSPYGKVLTAQRMGRMLVQSFNVHSTRQERTAPRGYTYASLVPAWRRMGIAAPVAPGTPDRTGASGAGGSTGASVIDSETSIKECPACTAPPNPSHPAGLCGADDRHHREAARHLGVVA